MNNKILFVYSFFKEKMGSGNYLIIKAIPVKEAGWRSFLKATLNIQPFISAPPEERDTYIEN
jgi:hypothetical protein